MTAPEGWAPSERLPYLDGFRAVAALMVVVSHTLGEVGFITPDRPGAHLADNLGNFGVALFFLLSAFVNFRPYAAASILAKPQPRTSRFLLRRFVRIYPAYWVALVAWALFSSPQERVPGSPFAMVLLLDPYNTSNVWLTGLYVSWSLTVEIAFYLALPFIALLIAKLAMRSPDPYVRFRIHVGMLIGLASLAYVYRTLPDHWHSAPYMVRNLLPAFFDWFALGMLLAVLHVWFTATGGTRRALQDLADRPWACWTCALFAYLALVFVKGDELLFLRHETTAETSWRFFFQGLAAFFLILPATVGRRPSPTLRLAGHRSMVFLGSVSFGIYLWHPVVMLWFRHAFRSFGVGARSAILTIVVVVLTIPIAWLSHRIVEQPFQRVFGVRAHARRSPDGVSTRNVVSAGH